MSQARRLSRTAMFPATCNVFLGWNANKNNKLGLDENAEVEVSTNGQVIVITAKRSAALDRKFRNAVENINRQYAFGCTFSTRASTRWLQRISMAPVGIAHSSMATSEHRSQ